MLRPGLVAQDRYLDPGQLRGFIDRQVAVDLQRSMVDGQFHFGMISMACTGQT